MIRKCGYKRTEVGLIPEDWDVKPLLSVVSIQNGQVDPKAAPYRSMILVAPDHIECRTGLLQQRKTASEQNAISGKYLFKPGDIIYSKIRPYLRKAIIAPFPGLCSADMYPLTPKDNVSAEFLLSVLLDDRFSNYASSVSARSGIPKINRDEIAGFSVALPPLSEQRAIAAALSDVDALLASLDALIAKKRAIKQGAMQELLTGKRRLPGFSGEWEVQRLGALSELCSGGTPTTTVSEYYGGNIPWASISDMTTRGKYIYETDRYLSEKGLNKCAAKMFPSGTVLYAMYASIGECSIATVDLCTSQAILGIRPSHKLNNLFLYYYLISIKDVIKRLGQQGTQANLNAGMVRNFIIHLPQLTEQVEIVNILSDIDEEINTLEQQRDKTHLLKQGMMQELLTGKTRLI